MWKDLIVNKLTIPNFVATMILLTFQVVILLWLLLPIKLDQSASSVVNLLIGALIAQTSTIVNFYFGSSKGSKEKDEQIMRLRRGE